jgi:hypothetical protein
MPRPGDDRAIGAMETIAGKSAAGKSASCARAALGEPDME